MENKIEIEGVICGKERPMLKEYDSGKISFRFSIQWFGKIEDREQKPYISIVLNGNLARQFDESNSWSRGQRVYVYGQLSSWMIKGTSNKFTEVVCNKLTMVGAKAKTQAAPPPIQEETYVDEEIPF